MGKPRLRILMLEDLPEDAELAARELLKDGMCFDWRRVEDEAGFLRELAEFSPDLILSDYTMPGFDAMSALRILQETGREIPLLFQPFQRTVGANRAVIPGTGLGLYTAKLIAEAHGGSIVLESEEGKGTTVVVRLPIQSHPLIGAGDA